MKKLLVLALVLTLVNITYSQTTVNNKINEIKTLFEKSPLSESEKTFFYNKAEKILEFGGFQIPFMDVKIVYKFNDEFFDYSDFVNFNCNYDKNCIVDSNNQGSIGLSIPFNSKTKCYEFINLISELRELYQ